MSKAESYWTPNLGPVPSHNTAHFLAISKYEIGGQELLNIHRCSCVHVLYALSSFIPLPLMVMYAGGFMVTLAETKRKRC